MQKVFGIGFHKTGTSSLATALEHLGYRVTGPNGVEDGDIENRALPMCLALAKEYDAFQDNPWPLVFKEMDSAFPGSRFILTVRDSAAWITSAVSHFGLRTTPMRAWIYGAQFGSPLGNEAIYIERYERHNREVLSYFSGRGRDRLLVLRIADGDGWEQLCPFLNRPVPPISFPHVNAGSSRN